jgi:serine protease Do
MISMYMYKKKESRNHFRQKLLLASFACLTVITSCHTVSAQESLPELIKRIESSVVTVTSYYPSSKRARVGSGFFIEAQQIISNWHVVSGANRIEVRTHDGRVLDVKRVTGYNGTSDVVMLTISKPEPAVPPLSVVRTLPEQGERVLVIGSPLGHLEGTVSDGIVSAIRTVHGVGELIQITAPVSRGSSGSPVLNMQGGVIGMATLMDVRGQNLNFAVSGNMIEKLRDAVYDKLLSDLGLNTGTVYSVPMDGANSLRKPRIKNKRP